MNTVKWSVVVPEATDNALRNYLAETGLKKKRPISFCRSSSTVVFI